MSVSNTPNSNPTKSLAMLVAGALLCGALGAYGQSQYAKWKSSRPGIELAERSGLARAEPAAQLRIDQSDIQSKAIQLRERLKTLGLSEDEAMPVVLTYLESRYPRNAPIGTYWHKGWRPTTVDTIDYEQRREEAVRTMVVAIYGGAAEAAKPFERYFQPLADEYPFLTAVEQRRLIKMRRENALRRTLQSGALAATSVAGVRPGNGQDEGARRSSETTGDPLESMLRLEEVMPKEKAFEIALRESSLAYSLRSSDVDYSESEFRAVFAEALSAARDHRPLTLSRMQAVLPNEKALRVIAAADPAMAAIRRVASGADLSDYKTWEIFKVYRESSDQVFDLLPRKGEGMNPGNVARVKSVLEERQRKIEAISGVEIARRIIEEIGRDSRIKQ